MRLTNKFNLPEAVAQMVAHDDYEKGGADYSVTELLSPPRQQALLQKFGDKLTEDVSDRIYAFVGKIGHAVFERARVEGDVVEHRVTARIKGKTISGKFDRLVKDDRLIDLKLMSVWEHMFGLKPEKVAQLNYYRLLSQMNGIKVRHLSIIGVFRDWSIGEAERRRIRGDTSYPQRQVWQYDVPIWDDEATLKHMKAALAAHEKARTTPHWYPECSAAERWEKPTEYALVKPTRKSALRKMTDLDVLKLWAVENNFGDMKDGNIVLRKDVSVETRVGESIRCSRYCAALPVCQQGQKIVQGSAIADQEASAA